MPNMVPHSAVPDIQRDNGTLPRMDMVILVDEHGNDAGAAPKLAAHETPYLHRAFSVFIFDDTGRVLLQRRADGKYHFKGLWSNTCCSHPRPGETVLGAARRRLHEELGIATELREAGSFVYYATDPLSGLSEHEFDHVVVGHWTGSPVPDPFEVSEWRWAEPADVDALIADPTADITPWLSMAWEIAAAAVTDTPPRVG